MAPTRLPSAAYRKQLRCACSTVDCRQNGSDTCSTDFKCYTQYLNKGDGSNPVSFGCTAGSTPLLCENRPPSQAKAQWPYLQCCDDSDFCNNKGFITPPQWARPRPALPTGGAGGAGGATSSTDRAQQVSVPSELRRSYSLNQPLVVSVLFVGLFLMLAIMAFGFYLLYQQSRYLKRECLRRGYVRAQDEMSSLVGTPESLESNVGIVASSSSAPQRANSKC